MATAVTKPTPSPTRYLPPDAFELNGNTYVHDSKGSLQPIEKVKPQHLLEDQLVRELLAEAEQVSEAIRAFKAKASTEIAEFQQLVDQLYGAKAAPGGEKGNVSVETIDGLVRVQIQVSEVIRFEDTALQAAKKLVDECLAEWSADANADLRAIVMNAFRVNKKGEINRGALLGLLRLDIADPRWVEAMRAIKDSIKPDTTKTYIRVHHRPTPDSRFEAVSLNCATA